MRTRATGRARGFTLIELMITVGLGVIVIAGALALLRSQQGAFREGAGDRAQQETARVALESITSNLRLAGFGLDPALAFDFGPQDNVRMAQVPAGTVVGADTLKCNAAVACRDSASGPDEIVFLARDPAFGHPLAQAYVTGSNSLVITGPLQAPLHQGQILQVMCFTGTMAWAYVTVASEVGVTADASVPVPIASGTTRFPNQAGLLDGDGCFASAAPVGSAAAVVASAAKVFKVDRFRYYLQSFTEGGVARPYLMLDQGLKDAAGVDILEVVTPDVEDLQFSYVFPSIADPALRLVGASGGTAIASGTGGIDLAPSGGAPTFADEPDALQRATHHPANIRAVRVAVVVRTPTPDPGLVQPSNTVVPAAGNRAASTGPEGFRRTLFETAAPIRNLDSRAPYFPSYTSDSAPYTTRTDQLNVGGG